MRLILMRHGQTPCNLQNIWHGWDDCNLTDEGKEQARAAADRLDREHVDAVYSSDTRRALQSALLVAQPHGLIPTEEEALRERRAGEFEGRPVDEVVAEFPEIWEQRARDYWNWRPPGGETFRQVLERSLGFIRRIEQQHTEQTVLVVSHMSPVRVLISSLANISIEETYEMPFPTTGISIFELASNSKAAVIELNDASHLDVAHKPVEGEFS